MLTVLVLLCPPLAVFWIAPSRVAQNLGLTLLLYVPGVLHARGIVEKYQVARRYELLMQHLETQNATLPPQIPTHPHAA